MRAECGLNLHSATRAVVSARAGASGLNPRPDRDEPPTATGVTPRRGKAPPIDIDTFTGDDPEIRQDDWLPTLDRAAMWYIQLVR